ACQPLAGQSGVGRCRKRPAQIAGIAEIRLWSADLQVRIMIMSGPGGPRSEDAQLLFSEPMPSEPSDEEGAGSAAASFAAAAAGLGAASTVTSSRNAAGGTKNSVPVTGLLKSSRRS